MRNILLITGASSDIGLDFIKNLNDDTLIIAHCHTNDSVLQQLATQIKNELVIYKANLSSESEVLTLVETIESKHGTPNQILHLAAPKFENIRFKDLTLDSFQQEIRISLHSFILILQKFLPTLAKQKRGKVLCMLSSVTLNVPPKALAQYTTVKYALLGLIKSLASEYADKNIQINALSPSMIETKFLNNINEKFIELNAHNHPLKRNAQVADITPLIKMFLSHESDYINGVNLPITGGSIF